MEEYGIMEYLELTVTRCGQWMGNREFIWSGLIIVTASGLAVPGHNNEVATK